MALPKTFTGGERLFANDLNDNFEALDTAVATTAANAANASNLTSGTIAEARLGDVPASKLTGKVPEANLSYVRGTADTILTGGVTVTFPAGSFTSPPTLVLGTSGLDFRVSSFRAKTASSFILDGYDDNSRNDFPVDWLAVGT